MKRIPHGFIRLIRQSAYKSIFSCYLFAFRFRTEREANVLLNWSMLMLSACLSSQMSAKKSKDFLHGKNRVNGAYKAKVSFPFMNISVDSVFSCSAFRLRLALGFYSTFNAFARAIASVR